MTLQVRAALKWRWSRNIIEPAMTKTESQILPKLEDDSTSSLKVNVPSALAGQFILLIRAMRNRYTVYRKSAAIACRVYTNTGNRHIRVMEIFGRAASVGLTLVNNRNWSNVSSSKTCRLDDP